jgi:hypothetical protein
MKHEIIRNFLTGLIFWAMIAVACVFPVHAQPGNNTGWQDTCTILNWKADSLKYGTAITAGTNLNKAMICMFSDTNQLGLVIDTVKGRYGYQRGFIVVNAVGKIDTTWCPLVVVDSFSTLPADTAGKWISKATMKTTDSASCKELWSSRMMDSLYVTGFVVCAAPVTPLHAPILRAWVQGLSGNRTNAWVKVRLQWQELKYIPVRQQ